MTYIVVRKALLMKVLPRGVCGASPLFSIMIALRILGAIVTSDDVVTAVVTPPLLIELMKAEINDSFILLFMTQNR